MSVVYLGGAGLETDSEDGSSSSLASSDWFMDPTDMITPGDQQTFRQQVDYLLTGHQKAALRSALIDYNLNRYGS